MSFKGFTLIELLIGAGICLVIISAALSAITDFMHSQNTSQKIYDTMIAADSIYTQLTRDIHNAESATLGSTTLELTSTDINGVPTLITYSLEPIDTAFPNTYIMHRNGEPIHTSKTVIVDDPSNPDDFFFRDSSNGALELPLVHTKMALQHTITQGARTVYETETRISLRRQNRSL